MIKIKYPFEKFLYGHNNYYKCREVIKYFIDVVSLKKYFQFNLLKIRRCSNYPNLDYTNRICMYLLTDGEQYNYWLTVNDNKELLVIKTFNSEPLTKYENLLDLEKSEDSHTKIKFLKTFTDFWDIDDICINKLKLQLNNGDIVIIRKFDKKLKLKIAINKYLIYPYKHAWYAHNSNQKGENEDD